MVDLTTVRGLILDMDGVLWKDHEPIGNLPSIFERIKRLGLQVILATNNATKDVKDYLNKLQEFDVKLDSWQVINSSMAAVSFLKRSFPQPGPVYVVGMDGLKRTLSEAGFIHHEQGDVLAVVVGMDRTLTYDKLRRATLLIRTGVPFIGTNPDRSFPTPEGLAPGAGAILAAIQTASDIAPIICGKPEPELYQLALNRFNLPPQAVLAVGDRLETDILGGQNIGCRTAVVLSGVTTLHAVSSWQPSPDIIADNLASVISVLENHHQK
jgi:4-nitrophenyl phosphatase